MAVTILLCYDAEDEPMVRQFRKQLSPLKRKGLIALWDDGNISPGTDREQELKKHLDEAQIILLLISPSFLDSDYCYNVQMQQAIQRHERKEARVLPVILRPVNWDVVPIDKLLPLPDGAKPISTWRNRDEGFKNVADGIQKVIEQWNTHSLPDPKVERKEMIANLDRLIESVKSQMQPPGRAMATAGTLQELSIFIPNDVTLADLVVGWRTLTQPSKQEEEIAIARRRVTCGELADMASQFTSVEGNLTQAIKTWQKWAEAFNKSDVPRQVNMGMTFARELTELQEAAQ
ncbi:MAG TPA: toll/interleukin-1 receptor domain-containing protein [Ktedonobacteraceae bacterium]